MQLDDREGVEDPPSLATTTSTGFKLRLHFETNGLSPAGLAKIAQDIASGDMNKAILRDCSEKELIAMSNGYQLSFLQTKAFIKAVGLLPHLSNTNNTKKETNGDNNNNNNDFVANICVGVASTATGIG